MNIIVAGQRIVTPAEFVEAAYGLDEVDELDVELDLTAGGVASRDALASFLTDFQVENDTDRENARYYRSLLRRMPRELHSRRKPWVTAVPAVAAELEAADEVLGYEDDEAADWIADWNAADFDSYQVLAELGTPAPAAAVTRARESRTERCEVRAALRLVRDAGPEVAA